ncbi:MAG: alanyl-tRNA editing protein [Oscillospiraceae bacterium]|nr:alanyl-tRNA editing protein [Oscillospiraceae bacterium]
MLTKDRLYYKDGYMREFEAQVTSSVRNGETWETELSETAFFPEGGGEPGDTGRIGSAAVLDTFERNGAVLHVTDAPLTPGETVKCVVDWERRFDFMQQHSGEHIFTGSAARRYGCSNVGFHIGAEAVTLDLDRELTAEQIETVETDVNEAIWKNLPVKVMYPSPEELKTLEYRSKKELEGDVRIVYIDGSDMCACCGIHVARTGEIGMLKVVDHKRYKGGVRISILCGRRALEDYRGKTRSVAAVSALLSAKPEEIAPAAERLLKLSDEQAYEIGALRGEMISMQAKQVREECEKICVIAQGLDAEGVWKLSDELAKRYSCAAAVSETAGGKTAYAVISREDGLKEFTARLNSALSGRGGGRPPLVRGTAQCSAQEAGSFFEAEGWKAVRL